MTDPNKRFAELVGLKICTRCKEEKQLTEFYSDKRKKDGKRPECKKCTDKKVTEYIKSNMESANSRWKRWKELNPEKVAASRKRDGEIKKTRKGFKLKERAHQIIRAMIDRGEIKRSDFCEICKSETKTIAHHPDYNFPKEAIWVCHKCHLDIHRQQPPA